MPEWLFREISDGFPERDPRETEFFRVTSPGEAVVREFIQNSLDARRGDQIFVKITLLDDISIGKVKCFLDDTLKKHLVACGFLEGGEYPERIRCLLLEDFGTTGLDGPYDSRARDGNFYNFWWREGISRKRAQSAGRWGLGKTTFHLVSKLRTLWGLTVRNDGKSLLMGKALLKTHSLNGKIYHYFGYFCENNFFPVEDHSFISLFKGNFKITRNETETGLSIIIPVPVDDIDFDSVLRGVIQHYYYPILSGTLKVKLQENDRDEELNNQTFIEKSTLIDWTDTEWDGIDVKRIFEFIKSGVKIEPGILMISDPYNPQITTESFGDRFHTIKSNFLRGEILNFRAPLMIRDKKGSQYNTFINILIKKFPDFKKSFEGYIRSGILVSDIKTLGNRPVAGLLIAKDPLICEFLGDCETPAHTSWNERTEGFAEKYMNAARILRFIKRSMSQIISILDEAPREREIDFLKHIFYVPVNSDEREGEEEGTRVPTVPMIRKKPAMFNIYSIQGGFRVSLNQQAHELDIPFLATLKIAYATRRGNPFTQYDSFDFDLANESLFINSRNCEIISRHLNEMTIKITGMEFILEVTGFDPKRDLVLDIKKK
jgi:hypothetical protein